MRSGFGKGMNVAVTAAKECSSSFSPPALRLVLIVVVCRPLPPLSSSSLSCALFDCCVCFCHCCCCGCCPNLTPHRRQAVTAAVLPPSCRRRCHAVAKLPQLPCHQSCRSHRQAATHGAAHASALLPPHCHCRPPSPLAPSPPPPQAKPPPHPRRSHQPACCGGEEDEG
jgi:hypothetical protein